MSPGRAIALAILLVSACDGAPEASAPDSTPRVPKTAVVPSTAERVEAARARYAARPVIKVPGMLPSAWRTFLEGVDGRLTRIEHEVRSHQTRPKGSRWLELEFRLFGIDADLDRRVHDGLVKLALPGLGERLPSAPVSRGDVVWEVVVDRLVAPDGAPRESRYIVRWRRVPGPPPKVAKCRKPPVVAAPEGTPDWLVRLTKRRTTRQRIRAVSRQEVKGQRITLDLFFRNGYAQDETVGFVQRAATRAGYVHQGGSGPKQRWRHPKGATLRIHPEKDDLRIGCTLEGPVLELVWDAAREG